MKPEKPIFIIGSGRSGSTVFHEILCEHPNAYWLSNLSSVFPKSPFLNKMLMLTMDIPIINNSIKSRIKPSESWNFWKCYTKSFVDPVRDIFGSDVTNKEKIQLKKALTEFSTRRRNRFIGKIVGWPRADYLHEIFKDAKFIHIIRDGRAVVNSIVHVDWWQGWKGHQNWQRPTLTEAQLEEWENYNKSFIALAAIEWKILISAHEKIKQSLNSDSLLEIKYEDLCSRPSNILKETIDFCELDWSKKIDKKLKRVNLNSANDKYKSDLTKVQIEILENILHKYLIKYDYK